MCLLRRRRLLAILLTATSIGPAVSSWAQGPQKKVLVLHSRARDTVFSIVADREMPLLLDRAMGSKVDYYSEHIDATRLPEAQYKTAFGDYLRLKYRSSRFDAVIATHQLAFDFLTSDRKELFPDAPIVFLTEDRTARQIPNSAGVVVERNYSGTLRLALQLQPDTTQVFVVSGSSLRDKANERVAREQFASLSPALTFTYLAGLTSQDIERRVAGLPSRSIVFYLIFYQDAAGANFSPVEYLDRLTSVANRPIYSWVDWTVGRGAVGGSVLSTDGQVEAVTNLAVRVLHGERPDSIPLLARTLDEYQVDWRQLQRWGIRDARVPAGTRIMFQMPSVLERYRGYIVTIAVLFLAQTAFIMVLFLQRIRLRRTEERARRSEAELRASYDRIHDLGVRLLTAQDAERTHIARELHDDISQQIAVVSVELQTFMRMAPQHEKDLKELERGLLDRVQEIGRSVHALSHRLHPAKLRFIGLVAAIDGLQRDFSRPNLKIVFSHDGAPPEVPHDVTLALFRMVQEAVQNAVEHSGAREVSVRLTGGVDGLTLTIVDDGSGFDVRAAEGKGLGLISMNERVDSIGGTLRILSSPGTGTRVEIKVPCTVPTREPNPEYDAAQRDEGVTFLGR
jgi:signal transduction histidine kinase